MAEIIILEDEQLIAEELALILTELLHEVIEIVNNPTDLFELLKGTRPDLILLDIELHRALDGIDVASELNRSYTIPFLFVSSRMDDNIIERAKFTRPLGFISKPFTPQRVKTQLALALHQLDKKPIEKSQSEFYLKENGSLVKVKLDEVLYVKAMDNYSLIQLKERRVVYSSTLKELIGRFKLSSDDFYRIHRSYFINLTQIDRVVRNEVVLSNGDKLPISDSKKQGLLSKLNLL